MKKVVVVFVVVVAVAAFLELTAPGHSVLASLGFATADCNGSNC
jgi:hypothetical protein